MQTISTTSAAASKRLVLKKERIAKLNTQSGTTQGKDNTSLTSFLF